MILWLEILCFLLPWRIINKRHLLFMSFISLFHFWDNGIIVLLFYCFSMFSFGSLNSIRRKEQHMLTLWESNTEIALHMSNMDGMQLGTR